MTSNVKLPPLPEPKGDVAGGGLDWTDEEMQDYARACVEANTEALRAEVERLETVVRLHAGTADLAIDAVMAVEARAERLEEALQLAIRQNSHDMLLTDDELRQCEAALHPTAAQEGSRE